MNTRLMPLIIVSILFISCKKDITLNNLNGGKIGCFGHAGMGSKSLYPANTLQSFETCLSRGADGTEMDIQVTRDGVLVIFHNDDLSSVTKCGGIIRDLTWDEISNCRINSVMFNSLDVMSFDEFFQTIDNRYKYTFTFDCKITQGAGSNDEYYKTFSSAIVSTIEKYGLQENVFIENSDPEFLNLIKRQNNQLKVFLLGEDFENDINIAQKNEFYGVSFSNNHISSMQIQDAHSKNIRVTLYGIESNKQNYDAISKQPDYIQTDDLDYVLKLFGKFNRNSGRVAKFINNISLTSPK